jgi:DNA polymerase-1
MEEGAMIALIDADSILYRFAAVNQEVFSWDGENTIIETDIDNAKKGINKMVADILVDTKSDFYEFILSPKRTFRYDVDESYKSNRKEPEVPLYLLPILKEWSIEALGAYTPDYVEADDYVVAKATGNPTLYVMCHIDKDLNQGAGHHYNYNTLEKYDVSQEEADFFFYQQVLEGDYIDGIKGCPKIGKKKSIRLLSDLKPEDYWKGIVEAYEKAGQTEEDALRNARLVRMLRHDEYNLETQAIKLWSPHGTK